MHQEAAKRHQRRRNGPFRRLEDVGIPYYTTSLGLPVRTAEKNGQGWWCQGGQLIGSPMAVPCVVSGEGLFQRGTPRHGVVSQESDE